MHYVAMHAELRTRTHARAHVQTNKQQLRYLSRMLARLALESRILASGAAGRGIVEVLLGERGSAGHGLALAYVALVRRVRVCVRAR